MAAAVVSAVNCENPGIGALEGAHDAVDRIGLIWPDLVAKLDAGWVGDPY